MKEPEKWSDLPLVEVVWFDAGLDTEPQGDLADPKSRQKFGKRLLCADVGYLIRKDEDELVMAVGICRDDDTYRHSNTIPASLVQEIIYLSRRRKS